jgi:hypothetical protein
MESDLWLKQAAFAKTNELAARAAVKPRRRAVYDNTGRRSNYRSLLSCDDR